MVLAELARSCGYHVEIEPRFPSTIETRLDPATGELTQSAHQALPHGDLLLVRHNERQLIDVTVARPTQLTLQRGPASGGAHLRPLVAASQAEKRKHRSYDAECAKHGWKLVPFVLESLGAKGGEARQLLQRMSAHSVDRSPEAFLAHADRLLSLTLQVGNAHVSAQGTADLLLAAYRRGHSDLPAAAGVGRGPGRNHLRRTAGAQAEVEGFSDIVHADYRSARSRVHGRTVAAA